jgi:integrase
MGSLYKKMRRQPDGTVREETTWWIKFYEHGVVRRESTGTAKEQEARRLLKAREGLVATGQPILPRSDRVRYDQIAADLREHFRTTGTRDLVEAEKRLKHLDAVFMGRRVVSIDGASATAYVARRQGEGAANGTINRELSVLTQMLRLAYENGRLVRLPVIRKLKEAVPRTGFCEPEIFAAIRKRLPEPHGLAVALCYTLAWRREEVFGLEWRHLDLEGGAVRLDAERSKNDEGRVAFLTPALLADLKAHRLRVEALQRRQGRVIPHVFVHLVGQRAGARLGGFRKRWMNACTAAGVPGLLLHDLRRSGVRNMVRAGISEGVAMKISGHRTRSVFDRYNITSTKDLQEAARRLTGTISGTIS